MHGHTHTTSQAREGVLNTAADKVEEVLDKAVHTVQHTAEAIASGVGDAVSLAAVAMPTPMVNNQAGDNTSSSPNDSSNNNNSTVSMAPSSMAMDRVDHAGPYPASWASVPSPAEERQEMRVEYQRARQELRQERDLRAGDLSLDSVVAAYHPAPVPTYGGPPSPSESADINNSPNSHPAPIPSYGGTPMPGDVMPPMPGVGSYITEQRNINTTTTDSSGERQKQEGGYRRAPTTTYGGPPSPMEQQSTDSSNSTSWQRPEVRPAPIPAYGGTPMPGDVFVPTSGSVDNLDVDNRVTDVGPSAGSSVGITGMLETEHRGILMAGGQVTLVSPDPQQARDTERHAPLQQSAAQPRMDDLTLKLGPDPQALRNSLPLPHRHSRRSDPAAIATATDDSGTAVEMRGTRARDGMTGVPQQSIAAVVEKAELPVLKPGVARPQLPHHLRHADPAGQLVNKASKLIPHLRHRHEGSQQHGAPDVGAVSRVDASGSQQASAGWHVMQPRLRSRL